MKGLLSRLFSKPRKHVSTKLSPAYEARRVSELRAARERMQRV
jgi:hypothetical protein